MKTYETRPGDTPSVIAKEQLGDCSRWREVVEFNAATHPHMGPHDWYRVGTFLRLPEVAAMSTIDHDEIYLQPVCCVNEDVGRLWCEDDDTEYCEDGKRWTRYVRADIHEAAVAELEALRQERDGLRARVAELVEVGTNCCDETPICQQEWNNAIAGASGVDTSIKVKAIHDSVAWLAKNYNHLAHPVCGLLTHYANQIEDAAMAKEQGE